MQNKELNEAVNRLQGKHVLVTGGAGFIGSNLVGFLLENDIRVSVLDNLATGRWSNLEEFENNELFTFINGDITDFDVCLNAMNGIDVVSHQAALGSVPRSIALPHNTHAVNATGFLNMLHAANEKGIKRFVYASSSSVYGNSANSPKRIGEEGDLLSPYAVTKQLNEEYAKVYHKLHQLETVGLRYFNVFGPKQDPNGVYAAAIPKFIDKMLNGEQITINGDGEQTRDFTYVMNAVQANVLGLSVENKEAYGKAFNVACGEFLSLNGVIGAIKVGLTEKGKFNKATTIINGPDRPGDVRDSLADISNTTKLLSYNHPVRFDDGMKTYLEYILKA
ncbi:MAG TPA: NAD-dependent epimerase/dehydratase family protein [Crocinitomicaceae bacterium]|nr:NAD-dependent epimerase/dehydratase family protein [Crocinitomicaceae bacterium]